jgi:hypothetical protein
MARPHDLLCLFGAVTGNNQCKDLGMKPPLPRTLSAVPQTMHARLEIAKAIRALAGPDEDELLRQRRAEIAAIRRDLEALSRDIRKVGEEFLVTAKAELRKSLKERSSSRPIAHTVDHVPIEANAGGQRAKASANDSRSVSVNTQNALHSAKAVLSKDYDPEEPRVPKHNPGGGRWTRDGTGNVADHANRSAADRNDGSAGGSADDANQSNKPIRVAAGLQCDGFPSGCQSGGSYGSSGMYNINGRVLCIDCAIKFFGLQDASQSERARTLNRFLIGK